MLFSLFSCQNKSHAFPQVIPFYLFLCTLLSQSTSEKALEASLSQCPEALICHFLLAKLTKFHLIQVEQRTHS